MSDIPVQLRGEPVAAYSLAVQSKRATWRFRIALTLFSERALDFQVTPQERVVLVHPGKVDPRRLLFALYEIDSTWGLTEAGYGPVVVMNMLANCMSSHLEANEVPWAYWEPWACMTAEAFPTLPIFHGCAVDSVTYHWPLRAASSPLMGNDKSSGQQQSGQSGQQQQANQEQIAANRDKLSGLQGSDTSGLQQQQESARDKSSGSGSGQSGGGQDQESDQGEN